MWAGISQGHASFSSAFLRSVQRNTAARSLILTVKSGYIKLQAFKIESKKEFAARFNKDI